HPSWCESEKWWRASGSIESSKAKRVSPPRRVCHWRYGCRRQGPDMRRAYWSLFAMVALSGRVTALGAQEPIRGTDQGVLVDFQEADLRLVVAALAEAGDINVVYGELPQRKVTLRMRQPVAKDGMLPLLKSLAQANGLRVIEAGGFLRLEAAGQTASAR